MHEDIISFVHDGGKAHVFYLEMTGVSYCDGTYKISRENSPLTVIEYVIQGQGTVISDGNKFTAAKGDVYLLHRGSTHCYYSDSADPWTKIWVNVGGPLVDSLMRDYALTEVTHIPGLDIKDLLSEILSVSRTWSGSLDELFHQVAPLLLKIVITLHGATKATDSTASPEALKLKDWLDRQIYQKVSIHDFASQIFRSASQAIRIFKSQYGVTPYDYLLFRRIETAKMLLQNTNLEVKEIAYRLKFTDEHYFSNYFKKRTGMSPIRFKGNASHTRTR